ncbi:MAG: 50S ribosomal protein L19e [Candidatus Lokiarchaeota archaeon]|nr:50S ribosomal protein L19e [Candidatus Lokiarchaeota archaeon]
MNVTAQKRMAAEILKCGKNRIFIDPEYVDDVIMAITREDIRNLIQQGIIQKRQKIGISKYRNNLRKERKKRGRARGYGKRKGVTTARNPSKRAWINTIRPLRRELKELRDTGKIEKSVYRKMYLRAKGGSFKSVATLRRYLQEQKLIKK